MKIIKMQLVPTLTFFAASLTAAHAQQPKAVSPAPPVPIPVYQAPAESAQPAKPAPAATHIYIYDQKPLQSAPALVSPEKAQAIVDQFRSNYPALDNPRVLIYVNRRLPRAHSAPKPAEQNGAVGGNAPQSAPAPGAAGNERSNHEQPVMTLADRQTVRDVERLFGRPLRAAGVTLVDQPGGQDLEALARAADVGIEILISSRSITVPEVSGDRTYTVPDIQATAVRLRDSKVIGQATAADVMARTQNAGYAARNFGVQDVTEATALALMEDILQGLPAK